MWIFRLATVLKSTFQDDSPCICELGIWQLFMWLLSDGRRVAVFLLKREEISVDEFPRNTLELRTYLMGTKLCTHLTCRFTSLGCDGCALRSQFCRSLLMEEMKGRVVDDSWVAASNILRIASITSFDNHEQVKMRNRHRFSIKTN